MSGPAISFSHVSLALRGTQILEDVTFSVQAGEIHCLVGPNGGGKTSLLRCLLGEMPHTGEISLTWQDSRVIGYVPQSIDLDRTLPVTVNDFFALIGQRRPAFLGLSRAQRRRTEEVLERVGLAGKGGRKLGDLSGGERQRVLLAQALMPPPALLLLDEPIAAIDEQGARLFEGILREVAGQGTTILWIAHDLPQVRRLANRVTCLNRTVRFHGVPEEVLTPESIAEIFGITARPRAELSGVPA
ncbi:MAG TPA: metal ABC transporter ATP-binding protein [Steroidobacteraceae bacterium]